MWVSKTTLSGGGFLYCVLGCIWSLFLIYLLVSCIYCLQLLHVIAH